MRSRGVEEVELHAFFVGITLQESPHVQLSKISLSPVLLDFYGNSITGMSDKIIDL